MTVAAESSPAPVPGTRPATAVDPPSSALAPLINLIGHLSISVDGFATNNPAGGPINVQKSPGATVRQALLFAASTGFTRYVPVNGDVTLDGSPVSWDSAHTISNSISSYNVLADVTSMVKPKLDAAQAGITAFTVAEPNNTFDIDGEILAVIFDDPTVTVNKSITLLYGAQNTTGDTFNVALTQPINKADPNQQLTFGLGISFGYQAPGVLDQYSLIDVNGSRLSSSAGGQDDCDQKYAAIPDFPSCGNGALLTVGGLGDSTSNPVDANATPQDACVPRCDDELYDLMPFVASGDTSFTIHTVNPSNDDNIFFGWLLANPPAIVSGCVSVTVNPDASNPAETDIKGSCLTPGEKVDVLLNTEAGGILVDQRTVSADGSLVDMFSVPPSFDVALPNAKGFRDVTVPVTSSTTYQLDVIGEQFGDGASLQVKPDPNGALSVTDTSTTVGTSGPRCSPANIVVEGALPPQGTLVTNGTRWIENLAGNRVKLHSVNWYGAEEADFVAGGLNCQSVDTIADQVRYDFNTVRLPWSNAMLEEDPGSCAQTMTQIGKPCISPGLLLANPSFRNLTAIGIYRKVIQSLAKQGVMVVLDNHTTDAQWAPGPKNGIWWGGQLWDDVAAGLPDCPGATALCWHHRTDWWKNDWITMVNLFQSESNVIGVDLRNEPNNKNSYSVNEIWCSDTATGTCPFDPQNPTTTTPDPKALQDEWGPTAEWAGDAILAAQGLNPRLLIFVEGLDFGGDLRMVFYHPLTLQPGGHLVYSPHAYHNYTIGIDQPCLMCDYGSITSPQLNTALGHAWGFIITQGQPYTAPVWVGEFGVCNTSDACATKHDGSFRDSFIDYLKVGDIDWAYWPLNGTDSDGGSSALDHTWFTQETFGILNTTWSAPQPSTLLSVLPEACTQGPGCP